MLFLAMLFQCLLYCIRYCYCCNAILGSNRYCSCRHYKAVTRDGIGCRWRSSEAEKELYHLIMLRIQDALMELEVRAKAGAGVCAMVGQGRCFNGIAREEGVGWSSTRERSERRRSGDALRGTLL